jgi:hypothetical protein
LKCQLLQQVMRCTWQPAAVCRTPRDAGATGTLHLHTLCRAQHKYLQLVLVLQACAAVHTNRQQQQPASCGSNLPHMTPSRCRAACTAMIQHVAIMWLVRPPHYQLPHQPPPTLPPQALEAKEAGEAEVARLLQAPEDLARLAALRAEWAGRCAGLSAGLSAAAAGQVCGRRESHRVEDSLGDQLGSAAAAAGCRIHHTGNMQ